MEVEIYVLEITEDLHNSTPEFIAYHYSSEEKARENFEKVKRYFNNEYNLEEEKDDLFDPINADEDTYFCAMTAAGDILKANWYKAEIDEDFAR